MYYTIFGSIVFSSGQDGVPEAIVCRHHATTVRADGLMAEAEAEFLMEILRADSYFIPQLCKWRIVNNTDHQLVVDDGVIINPGDTLDWNRMKSSEEHLSEMGEHYA